MGRSNKEGQFTASAASISNNPHGRTSGQYSDLHMVPAKRSCTWALGSDVYSGWDADDISKGYVGCFRDGDGPYVTPPWGGGRTLPAALTSNGFTLEQCAQAAADSEYAVFAMQASRYCFMGRQTDLAAFTTKLDNATCNTTPCLNGVGCVGMVNKAYWLTARTWPAFPDAAHYPCPFVNIYTILQIPLWHNL
jgi:hypothetical protein